MNAWIELAVKPFENVQLAALFLDALAKSLVVLTLAAGICALARRSSAAMRHWIWFLAVAGLPCLPLLTATSPTWQKSPWSVSTTYVSGNQISLGLERTAAGNSEKNSFNPQNSSPVAGKLNAGQKMFSNGLTFSAHFSLNWLAFGFVMWIAGFLLILFSVAVGQLRLRQFLKTAKLLDETEWTQLLNDACKTLRLRRTVILLQSADDVMPLTWGWRRPIVLLPADASNWLRERRRIVLLHELAHVKRWDCLTQMVASVVSALYWFNPLIWFAARRMRVERERACDDLVLSGGCKASDYAGHLVEIASSFRHLPRVAAIAMARPSGLAQRVSAIVDAQRPRRLETGAFLLILTLMGGIIFSVGGCKTGVTNNRADESNPLRQQQITRLEIFSAQKEKQSQMLAAAAGESISPEFQKFFTAATSGDWQTVTNMYASFKQRHPQYSHPHQHADVSLRTSYWQPVLEICLAYDLVVRCTPEYTQMAADGIIHSIPRGSIYFGGTDPGRGLPTAFCKSQVNADPFYTLTQNALADGTYLEYLQKTYGDQRKFISQLAAACLADAQLQKFNLEEDSSDLKKLKSELADNENRLAMMEVNPQTKDYQEQKIALESDLQRNIEIESNNLSYLENSIQQAHDDRLKEISAKILTNGESSTVTGQNPQEPKAIYIPTSEDSQKCFQDYIQDAVKRLQNHQLKPGENVKVSGGRTQVSGQVAVMEINGLLAKLIFDKNPGHEFFIEESFPLDWMYPYLEPHGLIFKINRQPLAELSGTVVSQDREYWQPRVTQMIGGWLHENTPVSDVIAFAKKVFLQHDLAGFTGDPHFVQNDYATRMFSKFRSALAGLYAWRAEHPVSDSEKNRMTRAADFAFRQALALCPFSPEVAERYSAFLKKQNRAADAQLVMDLADKFKTTDHAAAPAKAPVFQMRLVLDSPTADSEIMTNFLNGSSPGNREVLHVQKKVLLDQSAVQSATLSKNRMGYQQIEISFTDAGRKQFAEITRQHIHDRLAIIIDGKLWEAPVIETEIADGKAEISGTFSKEEAQRLVEKINEAIGN